MVSLTLLTSFIKTTVAADEARFRATVEPLPQRFTAIDAAAPSANANGSRGDQAEAGRMQSIVDTLWPQ